MRESILKPVQLANYNFLDGLVNLVAGPDCAFRIPLPQTQRKLAKNAKLESLHLRDWLMRPSFQLLQC